MSQSIFAGGIENGHRGLADHSCNILMIHGVHGFAGAADSYLAEVQMLLGLHNAVNIAAAFSWTGFRNIRSLEDTHMQIFFRGLRASMCFANRPACRHISSS